jgi:hypothetical protein
MEKRQFRAQIAMANADNQATQLAAAQKADAGRQFLPAIDATTGQPIPGRFISAAGQQMSLDAPQSKAPKFAPEAAKALVAAPNAGGLDPVALAEIAADNRYDIATRGLAQQALKKTKAEETKAPGVHRSEKLPSGLELVTRTDGSQGFAKTDFTPTDAQKIEAYKLTTGKEPKTAEEWDAAFYYAQGKQPPANTPAAPSASAVPTTRAKIKSATLISAPAK